MEGLFFFVYCCAFENLYFDDGYLKFVFHPFFVYFFEILDRLSLQIFTDAILLLFSISEYRVVTFSLHEKGNSALIDNKNI